MRRFKSRTTTVALLLLLVPCGFDGAAERHEWFTSGSGSITSCATFVKAEDAMTSAPFGQMPSHTWEGETWVEYSNVFEEWILGFVSGANLAARLDSSKQIRVDRAGTIVWVKQYCETHPDELLFMAASRFVVHEHQQLK